MKIGILTFHCAINYGAVLQTYAMQEYLKGIGHEVRVADYRPDYLLAPYRLFPKGQNAGKPLPVRLRAWLRALCALPLRWRRRRKFRQFAQRRLHLLRFDPQGQNPDFDALVFGSDQIWNPRITGRFDKIYFGHFPAAEGTRRIAYAASAGSVDNIVPQAGRFFCLLRHYSSVSVREKSLAGYIRAARPDMHVPTVADPVLLAGPSVFEGIALRRAVRKPYLLLFCLHAGDLKALRPHAESIARQRGLTIVEMASMSESLRKPRQRNTESPEGFVSLLRHADYVVTSSFHGTAFAILFKKDFNAYSLQPSASERMADMLSLLGLSGRLIAESKPYRTGHISYGEADARLALLRKESATYLEKALSSPHKAPCPSHAYLS